MSALFLLAAAAGAAPYSWTVDATSLNLHRGSEPVESYVSCPDPGTSLAQLRGKPLTTLGVAVVVYSRSHTTMTWGHASLRVIYCLDGEVVDAEFEAYRLSNWNESLLREEHEGEAFAEGPWLTGQRGRLALFRNDRPVDDGWYAEQQAANREIYELWLDLEQGEMDQVVISAEDAHQRQLRLLRARTDLPRRYNAPTRYNCTIVLSEHLPARVAPRNVVFPFAWLRELQPTAVRVMHPSHYRINQWKGQLPAQAHRPRPFVKLRRTLRRELLPALRAQLAGAQPSLPWLDRSAAIVDRTPDSPR